MRTVTKGVRWLGMLCILASFAGTAFAQRTVTLTLNTATVPDTIRTDSFIEVRGAANGVAPATLADGNMIDWSDVSTLEPENIGGDYWRIQFQIADTTDLTFKFYSDQLNSVADGWEIDPNPNIPPGAGDTTLALHFFEFNGPWRGRAGDKGPYNWRPFDSKEDSVAVWFRVAMFGAESEADGYDPAVTAPAQQIGVRGDNLDVNGDGTVLGPVDWGVTQVVLQRESPNENLPGYQIYSGVGYYPSDLVGSVQNYKFVLDDDVLDNEPVGWEEGNVTDNRTFTVPAQDTTLQWVYYGNTPPVATEPVTSALIFAVDLSPLEAIGIFDVARGDTLEVRGGFNGWDCVGAGAPDDCLLDREAGSSLFAQVVPVTAIPGTEIAYKFFLNINDEAFMEEFGVDFVPSGWEEPISTTGANRTVVFEGIVNDFQDVGLQFFNDVLPGNIVGEGESIDVTFTVDMTAALTNDARPFDAASGDSVWIELGDPIWAFTQGAEGGILRDFVLTDDDGDNVFTGTLTVDGPTFAAIQYKYAYGMGSDTFAEPGGDTSTAGRRRTRFVTPNDDGSFPDIWSFPDEVFQVEAGPLPFESNPIVVGVEVVDGELPEQISLGANYPNPFNPVTSFQYSIPSTERVRVRVFDVMGRVVATLVDGVQQAATYEVSFDASRLASGVYIYQLETPTRVVAKKMLLLK